MNNVRNSARYFFVGGSMLLLHGCVIDIINPNNGEHFFEPQELIAEMKPAAVRSSFSATIDGRPITNRFDGSLRVTAAPPGYCVAPAPQTSRLVVSADKQGGRTDTDTATFTNALLDTTTSGFSHFDPTDMPADTPCLEGVDTCSTVGPSGSPIVRRSTPAGICFKVDIWPSVFGTITILPLTVTPNSPLVSVSQVGGAANSPGTAATAPLKYANATSPGVCFSVANLRTGSLTVLPVPVLLVASAKCYQAKTVAFLIQ